MERDGEREEGGRGRKWKSSLDAVLFFLFRFEPLFLLCAWLLGYEADMTCQAFDVFLL